MLLSSRRIFLGLALTVLASSLPGCAPRLPRAPEPFASRGCPGGHLAACAKELLKTGRPSRAAIDGYMAARTAQDPEDTWASVWKSLGAGATEDPRGAAAVLVSEDSHLSVAARSGLRVIKTSALPPIPGEQDAGLLMAMAAAQGYQVVIWNHGGIARELFPNDPLAPFLGGLLPQVADATSLRHLDRDLAIAEAVVRAIQAAGAFRYHDTAIAARDLERLLDGFDQAHAPAIRGRYALVLLRQAGLVIEEPAAASDSTTPKPFLNLPAGAPQNQSPYEALLRVMTAVDRHEAWASRGPVVLGGLPERRHANFALLFASPAGCGGRVPPPMEGPQDLLFAEQLSTSLSHERAGDPDKLRYSEWLPRYESLVAQVERTKSVWAYVPALLDERGDGTGLDPKGTPTYEKVTALAVRHIEALAALAGAYPASFRVGSQLGLLTNAGVMRDERLRKPLLQMTLDWEQAKIAQAANAGDVLEAVATGIAIGASLPAAIKAPFDSAMLGAVTARLRGDFRQKAGWDVAGLFSLDAALRVVLGQPSVAASSAREVARSLSSADLPYPAPAAVLAAAAEYAGVALDQHLDPHLGRLDRFPPDRRQARERMRSAIESLSPAEGPAEQLLDDVTSLADGVIAVAAELGSGKSRVAEPARSGRRSDRGAKNACADEAPRPRGLGELAIDPPARRAIARLAELRRRILASPRLKAEGSLGVRRLQLLVMLLSDAVDYMVLLDPAGSAKEKAQRGFAIPDDRAHANVRDALREWGRPQEARVLADGYVLLRALVTSRGFERFLSDHGSDLRRLVGSSIALAGAIDRSGDAAGPNRDSVPILSASLVQALAAQDSTALGSGGLVGALLACADGFYASNHRDEADLCLLLTVLATSVLHAPPPDQAIDLAERNRSRLAWALRYVREIRRGPERSGDPRAYEQDLRKLSDDACRTADAKLAIDVAHALHDVEQGARREGRLALDAALEQAEKRGLDIPRITYRYEARVQSLALSLSVGLSLGSGVLQSGSDYHLGLGVRTAPSGDSAIRTQFTSSEAPEAASDAARYYVSVAALAAVLHFLDHDEPRAIGAARRVVAALASGIKLGPRRLISDTPTSFGSDARPATALAAELAAEANMPLLAGDLWTVVRQGGAGAADAAALASSLGTLPQALAGVRELLPVVSRAKRPLSLINARNACSPRGAPAEGLEAPGCDLYSTALSLRVADALERLPRLGRGPGATDCDPLRPLDGFLASQERGQYDPDLLTRAVMALHGAGKLYDAAILLTRQRRPNHCSPALLSEERSLGRTALLGPLLRSDLLSSAVNCTQLSGSSETEADIVLLDSVMRELPDPARNLRLLLAVADLSAQRDTYGLLGKLTSEAGFVDRWLAIHPTAGAAALLLDHAAITLNGGDVDVERTQDAYQWLCETLSQGDRAPICATIAELRVKGAVGNADRRQIARDGIKKLLSTVKAP